MNVWEDLLRKMNSLLQPRPQLSCTDVARSKAQPADHRRSQNRYPWDLPPIQGRKHLWRMPVHCQRIQ